MSLVGRTKVTLRFVGDDLDPDTLTAMLGCRPTSAKRAGEVLPSGYVVVRGSWHMQSELCVPGDLDTQIRSILASLTSDLAVWNDLAERYRANLFCGLFLTEGNQEIVLSSDTMAAIGLRGIKLGLDIYGAEMPDETASW